MRNILLVLIPIVIVVLGFIMILGEPSADRIKTICAVMLGGLVLSYILRGSGGDNGNSK